MEFEITSQSANRLVADGGRVKGVMMQRAVGRAACCPGHTIATLVRAMLVRTCPSVSRVIVLFVAIVGFPAGAAADDWGTCADGEGDAAIVACTHLIESEKFKGHDLAITYLNRGVEWKKKGQIDDDLRDYNEAIRERSNIIKRHTDLIQRAPVPFKTGAGRIGQRVITTARSKTTTRRSA